MNHDPSAADPVSQLAEEFAERFRRGERPSISEYTAMYPELAGRIATLFPALVLMEQVGADDSAPSCSSLNSAALATVAGLEEVGDYRILREIGRGGMGVVYEAEQVSLRRHVALKVLPFQFTQDGRALERFRREAQAAAKLHHSNIVPVFEVGQEGQIHFYAMQFIQGQGLDCILDELRHIRRCGKASGADAASRISDHVAQVGEMESQAVSAKDVRVALPQTVALLAGLCPAISTTAGLATASDDLIWDDDSTTKFANQESMSSHAATERVRQHGEESRTSFKVHSNSPFVGIRVESNLSVRTKLSEDTDSGDQSYYHGVARIGIQVADALAYAHGRGVLHRDIKPSNILLDLAGTAWVTDFGLAKSEGDSMTRTGDIVGTIRYMAPERFKGSGDARSDVYAVGMTLYELLTLVSPFSASDHLSLIHQVTSLDPPRPRSIDCRLPSDLETVVLKAVDKDPARRYQTSAELADDLRRFLDDRPIRARRVGRFEQTWRWCRRNRALAGLMAAVLVLLAALASGSLVASIQLSRSLGKSNEHLGTARRAEGLAEERLQLSEQQMKKAEQQRKLANARLWGALVEQSQARRMSRRPGQRFESLAAIRQALHLPIPDGRSRDELRNEAFSALLLPDLQAEREWDGWPQGSTFLAMDPQFTRYARGDLSGIATVHRVADHVELARLAGRSSVDGYDGLRFSPDGRYLFQRCYQNIESSLRIHCKIWDLSVLPALAVLEDDCFTLDFSGDSSAVALGFADGTVQVHELPSGSMRQRFQAGGVKPYLKWNPVLPRLAAAAGESGQVRIRVFDTNSGETLRENADSNHWGSMAWHSDGRLLAISDRQSVMIWDTEADRLQLPPFAAHTKLGVLIEFDHTGDRFLTTSWAGEVRLWDRRTGQQLLAEECAGTTLQVSSDGKWFGADTKFPRVRLFQYAAGRESWILAHKPRQVGNSYEPCRPVWLNDRLMAVTSTSGVAIVDVAIREEIAVLSTERQSFPLFLESSPHALWIYGASGILRWPIAEGSSPADGLVLGPPTRESETRTTNYWGSSRDGRVVAIPQSDRGAILWQRERSRKLPLGPQPDVRQCDVSPDGRYVATGSHNAGSGAGARIWDADSGELLHELPVGDYCFVQFSPDSRWLVTSSGGIRIWNVATGAEGVDLHPESPRNFRTAFTFDSRVLAFSDAPGVVRFVDVESGRSIARMNTPDENRLSPLSFAPDGSQLICYGMTTGMLHVIDLVAVRRGLRDLNLDWDSDSLGGDFNSAQAASRPALPVTIRVDRGE